MHPARLVIMCGPPDVDTTHCADRLAERFGATRLSADDWIDRLGVGIDDADVRTRIVHIQADLTIDLLRRGVNVVVESGASQDAERDALRRRAIGAGALVHLAFSDAQIDGRWRRPTAEEIATYDPLPPVGAGDRPWTASFPYGSWIPQSRPR